MTPFSLAELETLKSLITEITGAAPPDDSKMTMFASNVQALMKKSHCAGFADYLEKIGKDPAEFAWFVSAITNHTTSWFREPEHFSRLEAHLEQRLAKSPAKNPALRFWSAACSSGQEVYSLALMLEALKLKYPALDYRVEGTDIDPVSIRKAKEAVYKVSEMAQIPPRYQANLLVGTKSKRGWFTLSPDIRAKCRFSVLDLNQPEFPVEFSEFDLILCRNVLIYFDLETVQRVIKRLARSLASRGVLIIGHSESLPLPFPGLKFVGNSIFEKAEEVEMSRKQRTVLVVDDLLVIRTVLKTKLSKSGFRVVESADALSAERELEANSIDLISLDLNMPGKNGADWLRELRSRGVKIPVVIVSASTPENAQVLYGAFENGAQEYFVKEELVHNLDGFVNVIDELTTIKGADDARIQSFDIPRVNQVFQLKERPEVILVGASTGGPDAIWRLIKNFKRPTPPIVVVQHTSSYFAYPFAKTLAENSGLKLGGEKDGEFLQSDAIYAAWGDWHVSLEMKSNRLLLRHLDLPPIWGHRPSVDELFKSAAKLKIPKVAVLLTGMGADGADGMSALLDQGMSYNIAQSEKSCVVFGMPREALRLNAAHFIGDIAEIRKKVESLI